MKHTPLYQTLTSVPVPLTSSAYTRQHKPLAVEYNNWLHFYQLYKHFTHFLIGGTFVHSFNCFIFYVDI